MSLQQRDAILAMGAQNPLPANATPAQIREWADAMADSMPVPADVSIERTHVGSLEADLIRPDGADDQRLIIYYHGGGFLFGSSRSHRVLVTNLADQADCVVLVANYRLAPEHPMPSAHDDALAIYQWALTQGFAPNRIAFVGDSAGGNLALSTAVRAKMKGLPLPAALGLFSPWLDLAAEGDSHREFLETDPMLPAEAIEGFTMAYVGQSDRKAFPPTPLDADLSGLPPTLVHVGSWERLRDDSIKGVERMRQAGVAAELKIFDGMFHVWQLFVPMLDEAKESVIEVARFIRHHLD